MIRRKFLIFFVCLMLTSCTTQKTSKQNNIHNDDIIITENIKNNEGEEILNINAKLPSGDIADSIGDAIDDYYQNIQAEYNQKIKNELYDLAQEEYLSSKENNTAFRPYEIDENYKIVFENENIISIVRTIKSYTGGLHENEQIICETFSKKTGEKLLLEDLFEENFNKELLNKLKDSLNKQQNTFFDDAQNYLSTAIENQSFYFTENEIVFVYESYVLAPFSEGTQYLKINLKDINNILKEEFK